MWDLIFLDFGVWPCFQWRSHKFPMIFWGLGWFFCLLFGRWGNQKIGKHFIEGGINEFASNYMPTQRETKSKGDLTKKKSFFLSFFGYTTCIQHHHNLSSKVCPKSNVTTYKHKPRVAPTWFYFGPIWSSNNLFAMGQLYGPSQKKKEKPPPTSIFFSKFWSCMNCEHAIEFAVLNPKRNFGLNDDEILEPIKKKMLKAIPAN